MITSFAHAVPVTPSDTAIIPATAALYVGGTGATCNLSVVMAGAQRTVVQFQNITTGTWVPISVVKVMATGTNASEIIALR